MLEVCAICGFKYQPVNLRYDNQRHILYCVWCELRQKKENRTAKSGEADKDGPGRPPNK